MKCSRPAAGPPGHEYIRVAPHDQAPLRRPLPPALCLSRIRGPIPGQGVVGHTHSVTCDPAYAPPPSSSRAFFTRRPIQCIAGRSFGADPSRTPSPVCQGSNASGDRITGVRCCSARIVSFASVVSEDGEGLDGIARPVFGERAAHDLAVEHRPRGHRRHPALQRRLPLRVPGPAGDAPHRQLRVPMAPHPQGGGLARIADS